MVNLPGLGPRSDGLTCLWTNLVDSAGSRWYGRPRPVEPGVSKFGHVRHFIFLCLRKISPNFSGLYFRHWIGWKRQCTFKDELGTCLQWRSRASFSPVTCGKAFTEKARVGFTCPHSYKNQTSYDGKMTFPARKVGTGNGPHQRGESPLLPLFIGVMSFLTVLLI